MKRSPWNRKRRAFSPRFLTGFYFEPRGGYQPGTPKPIKPIYERQSPHA
nr:MAG TPA: hypothetical protein [Caudoviricetes sp.]